MKTVNLEDRLLFNEAAHTLDSMKYKLDNIKLTIYEKFGSSSVSENGYDLIQKTISEFGAIYGALGKKLKSTRNEKTNEFIRTYMTYVASEGLIQLLSSKHNEHLLVSRIDMDYFFDFNINFNKTDRTILVDIINNFHQELQSSQSLSNLKNELNAYFETINNYCLDNLNSPLMSDEFNDFANLKITGKNFVVEGIKKKREQKLSKTKSNKKKLLTKDLGELVLDPVKKDDIVANEMGIDLIETEIPNLMHYDTKNQINAFKDFNQYIIFVGKPGTGKTMLARYAMTYAQNIAQKNNIPLSLVKLDFEDRYQMGPVDNIKNQFSEITKGNRLYIVFIDEIDKKIPSSNGTETEGYRSDIVGEFLRFRGGGDYINKRNYLFIGTSNTPSNIHPAILDVCHIEEVEGPRTKKEKVKVLYNSLSEGLNLGYVQIGDWKTIGDYLDEANLNARNIVSIASNAKTKYKKIASQIDYSLSPSDKQKMIKKIISKQGNGFVTRDEDVINAIINQSQKSNKIKNYVGQNA